MFLTLFLRFLHVVMIAVFFPLVEQEVLVEGLVVDANQPRVFVEPPHPNVVDEVQRSDVDAIYAVIS
jgi:hypothetical protein